MKTRTLVSILILVLAVLTITNSCATTPKTEEERGLVKPKVFFRSVVSGDLADVKKLIEAGADVNTHNIDGRTVLINASYSGHTEVAQLLREAGAEDKDPFPSG